MYSLFKTYYIDEPDLIFGHQGEEKDPRIGLRFHGPFQYASEKEPTPNQVRVGIIGSGKTVSLAKQVIEYLKCEIDSSGANEWLYPKYPGFSKDTSIKCDFVHAENWEAKITEYEIKKVLDISDNVNKRITAGVNLFVEKVNKICLDDNPPDVILCLLPFEIEEYCGISERTRGACRPKFTAAEKHRAALKEEGQTFLEEWGFGIKSQVDDEPLDLNFRRALKGKIMQYGIPIQILRESSARGFLYYGEPEVKVTQEPATFAWNLATALYYKANGKPWRLAKLRQDTCFVGISFFHNLRNPDLDVQTSMAQVFTHNGQGIVLRGKDVIIDKKTRQAYMSKIQATELLKEALKTYSDRAGRLPSRVVIHKTTQFSKEEKEGFNEAIGEKETDFVSINTHHDFRFLRNGDYPVLRGTVIQFEENRCLLFTSGYIPRIRTYPGHRIPKPLLITHHGDSELFVVCKEIMGLTKLNWNTTAFSTYYPITLEFSQKVGRILSELPEGRLLQNHYRFYM